MASRLETVANYDGVRWMLYSERPADIRRFTEWFGAPTRLGREGKCAHWVDVDGNALRLRRRPRRSKATPLTGAAASAVQRKNVGGLVGSAESGVSDSGKRARSVVRANPPVGAS